MFDLFDFIKYIGLNLVEKNADAGCFLENPHAAFAFCFIRSTTSSVKPASALHVHATSETPGNGFQFDR